MSRFVRRLLGYGTAPKSVSVEIPTRVFDRIKEAVRRSNTEEGGKFLGRVVNDGRGIHIQVDTYIDSGPQARRATTHIIPDGEYQDALLRVIEQLDPEIDFVGSWHSHHCNGLAELSCGDNKTYLEYVNNQLYKSDVFFVFLVVGIDGPDLIAKSFLFIRGEQSGHPLRADQIAETDRVYPFSSVLEVAEHATRQSISRFEGTAASAVVIQPNQEPQVADALSSIRAEDSAWFNEHLPNFKTTRVRRTGSIAWSGRMKRDPHTLTVRYEHPQSGESPMLASMLIMSGAKVVASYKIPLDEHRHAMMARLLEAAFGLVEGPEGQTGTAEDNNQRPAVDGYC